MKKITVTVILGIILFFSSKDGYSQNTIAYPVSFIEPYRLNIAFSKTTNLVFPFAIQSVDRGSRDVLAQKAKGVENILEVKAAKRGFEETNLTVVTSDGKLYSYLLNYNDAPSVLNIRFLKGPGSSAADFSGGQPAEAELQIMAAQVAAKEDHLTGIGVKRDGMKLQLKGLYIHDSVFYCQFTIGNKSAINYDIDQFRFFIRDQKKVTRTAAQELEILPIYTYGDTGSVNAHSRKVMVFALSKFTIPDQKYLEIQVMEKNGGRHLEVRADNKDLVRSKSL